VVFLAFVPLAFTEDFLEAAFGLPQTWQERARLPVVDIILLSLIWVLARWQRRREPRDRGLLTWWFLSGSRLESSTSVRMSQSSGR
jgi:hypothetical protein